MERLAISVAETVHASGMGKTTVYKLINEGSLASVRVGRRRLVIVASLQELLQ
ncbi:helix-turn-helix domain-containing protein [Sphingomonas hankookensis]|uniref:helix-turn-helix domain-containing protein n=1 Tax=Sphingomonas hankookensis TaxID=563996 RepID=UPI002412373D|nr:helix-turn-helix domain-containing protein [Sphingomonas hankookensis]